MTNETEVLMNVLHFLGRFRVKGFKIENIAMDTKTGKSKHTLTIDLEGSG